MGYQGILVYSFIFKFKSNLLGIIIAVVEYPVYITAQTADAVLVCGFRGNAASCLY